MSAITIELDGQIEIAVGRVVARNRVSEQQAVLSLLGEIAERENKEADLIAKIRSRSIELDREILDAARRDGILS